MNKFTILLVLFVFSLASFVLAQEEHWIYNDMFVDFWTDDGFEPSDSYGIHGVAVAPDGNVWINFYDGAPWEGISTETVVKAPGDTVHFYPLWILDPETKEHVSFSPLRIVELPGGELDSITAESEWSGGGRGIAVGIDGNILSTCWATLYKINYQTGAGIAKWHGPSSMTDASQADDGKIFIGRVSGNQPIWILDADLVEIGTAVDTAAGLSRSLEVTGDGKDMYRATIWNGVGIQHYHSELPGVLKYELVDVID